MRPIPDFLLEFLKRAEALWLVGKADLVGKPTWGYGHTGPDVVIGGAITEAQADGLLYADAVKAAMRLASVVKADVIARLTDHQYAALVSFVFNLGCDPKWTLWKLLNTGSALDCIPVQMMRFDKARVNGQLVEVRGLFNRRAAEVTLWKTADVAAAIAVVEASPVAAPSSAETSTIPTPPTPMMPKPAMTSKSVMGGAATAVLAVGSQFMQQIKALGDNINDAITPYVGSSAVLQHLQGELMLALAGCAVAAAVFAYLKNREAM